MLAVAVVEIFIVIVWILYNYFGGGGVLGNRYFMSTYGLFLFLLPPMESVAAALVPWVVGMLFTAQITLNAFATSFNPADHTKRGPLRWLPVELTMINTLPITTRIDRVRVLFGNQPALPGLLPRRQRISTRRGVVLGCAATRGRTSSSRRWTWPPGCASA